MEENRTRTNKVSRGVQLVALFLFCGGLLNAQEPQGNIVGQLRLLDSGFPSERIQVTLEGHGSVVDVTYSDSEGRFGFNHLISNAYVVVVQAEGFQPVRVPVTVIPSSIQTNIVHIVLEPKPAEKKRDAPSGLTGTSTVIVDVAELKKKFPAGAIKEFEAGKKAEQHGDLDSATTHYMAAIREAPDFYPAHNSLGIRHIQKGELTAAEFEFRRVIELNPNGSQAYFNLGNVLYIMKRNEEAKETLEVGLRLAPSSAMGHYLNGSVLARMGDFKTAEAELKSARELDPKMPQVPISLATLYLQSGREHEAAEMFGAFLKQFPNDPMAPKVRAALSKLAAPQPASP